MNRPWVRIAAGVVLAVALLAWLVLGLTVHAYTVASFANEPAVTRGDHILIRTGHDVHVGDLVVYRPPVEGVAAAISRVVGVAGDRLVARGGPLLRNGKATHDGSSHGDATLEPLTVPRGKVFLMGDNRENSEDSRFFGPVDVEQVKGRIISTHGRLALAAPVVAVLAAVVLLLTFRRRPTPSPSATVVDSTGG